MSAPATKPNPAWVGCPTLDLISAADEYEMTADCILVHEHALAEDVELASFLLSTAADLRTEIARRTRR